MRSYLVAGAAMSPVSNRSGERRVGEACLGAGEFRARRGSLANKNR